MGGVRRSVYSCGKLSLRAHASTRVRGDYVKTMPTAIARHRAYSEIPEARIGW